jgi:hypothetical protein
LQDSLPVIPVLVPPTRKLTGADCPVRLRPLAECAAFVYEDGNEFLGKVNDWLDRVGKILDKLTEITKRLGCLAPEHAEAFDEQLEKAGKAFDVLGKLFGKNKLERLMYYIEHREYLLDKALMAQIGALLKGLKGLHQSGATLLANAQCVTQALKDDLQKVIKDGEGIFDDQFEPPPDDGPIKKKPSTPSARAPGDAPLRHPAPDHEGRGPLSCLFLLLLGLVFLFVGINPLNIGFSPRHAPSQTPLVITPTDPLGANDPSSSGGASGPASVGCQIAPAGASVHIRQYPGTEYPVVGVLYQQEAPVPVLGYAFAADTAPYYLVDVQGIRGWITSGDQFSRLSGNCDLSQLQYIDPGFPQPPNKPPNNDQPKPPPIEQSATASFSIRLAAPSSDGTSLQFGSCDTLTYYGTSPALQFYSTSAGGNGTYLWDFGDGTTSTLPSLTHVYGVDEGKSATFTIILYAYNTDGTYSKISQCLVVTSNLG